MTFPKKHSLPIVPLPCQWPNNTNRPKWCQTDVVRALGKLSFSLAFHFFPIDLFFLYFRYHYCSNNKPKGINQQRDDATRKDDESPPDWGIFFVFVLLFHSYYFRCPTLRFVWGRLIYLFIFPFVVLPLCVLRGEGVFYPCVGFILFYILLGNIYYMPALFYTGPGLPRRVKVGGKGLK